MSFMIRSLAVLALIAMIVPVSGCVFSSSNDDDNTSPSVATGDNSLSINLTGAGGITGALAPQRAIKDLRKEDISIYQNTNTTPLTSDKFIWDNANATLKVLNCGTATYTFDVAKVARFAVPTYNGRETAADILLPTKLNWEKKAGNYEGGALADSYVTVGVKVVEIKKNTSAKTNGTFISHYKYYTTSQVASDGYFGALDASSIKFYKWSDIGDKVPEPSTKAIIYNEVGTVAQGATNKLTSTNLGAANYASINNLDEFDAAFASTSDSLLNTGKTDVLKLVGFITGQKSITVANLLSVVESSSANKLDVQDIIVVRTKNAIKTATTATKSDEAFDYGDKAYFVVITRDEEIVSGNRFSIGAVIHSNADGNNSNAMWGNNSYRIDVPVVTSSQTDVWGTEYFSLDVTPANAKNGVLDITFTITDRGTVKQVRKSFRTATAPEDLSVPGLTLFVDYKDAKNDKATRDYTERENNPILKQSNTVFVVANTNVEKKTGTLFVNVTNSITAHKNINDTILPTGLENADLTRVNDPSKPYHEFISFKLKDFEKAGKTYAGSTLKPKVILSNPEEEEDYVVKIEPPTTGAIHTKYGTFSMAAYVMDESKSLSEIAEKTLVIRNKGLDDDEEGIEPDFTLGWDSASTVDSSEQKGIEEGDNIYLVMEPEKEFSAAATNKDDASHLVFYVRIVKDGLNEIDNYYHAKTVTTGTVTVPTASGVHTYLFGENGLTYSSTDNLYTLDTGLTAKAGTYTVDVVSIAPNGKIYNHYKGTKLFVSEAD